MFVKLYAIRIMTIVSSVWETSRGGGAIAVASWAVSSGGRTFCCVVVRAGAGSRPALRGAGVVARPRHSAVSQRRLVAGVGV